MITIKDRNCIAPELFSVLVDGDSILIYKREVAR